MFASKKWSVAVVAAVAWLVSPCAAAGDVLAACSSAVAVCVEEDTTNGFVMISGLDRTWSEANDFCLAFYGTHLAIPTDHTENDAMYDMIVSSSPCAAYPATDDNSRHYSAWIGVYYDGSNWVEEDDDSLTFTNWYPSKPTKTSDTSATIGRWRVTSKEWNDEDNDRYYPFFCKL